MSSRVRIETVDAVTVVTLDNPPVNAFGFDLRVALASYFLQVNRKLQSPKIIEMKLFEQTRASAYRDELTGFTKIAPAS